MRIFNAWVVPHLACDAPADDDVLTSLHDDGQSSTMTASGRARHAEHRIADTHPLHTLCCAVYMMLLSSLHGISPLHPLHPHHLSSSPSNRTSSLASITGNCTVSNTPLLSITTHSLTPLLPPRSISPTMLARSSMLAAHLSRRGFATSSRSNVHVTVLGATGGIGQPCESILGLSLLSDLS